MNSFKIILLRLGLSMIILSMPPPIFASTCVKDFGIDVFGPIIHDTTWTKDVGLYCVTQNITVLENVTLTIEPGVVVKFWEGTDQALDNKFSFIIEGELNAIGSENDRVLFTSSRVEPEKGDWNYISFSENSIGALFDKNGEYISGSILKYVTIEYGGGDNNKETINAYKSPYIENVIIQNNNSCGLYLGTSTKIIDSSFIDNKNYEGYGGAIYAEKELTIIDSYFFQNVAEYGGAIVCRSSLDVSGSTFILNIARDGKGGAINCESTLSILNSSFENNFSFFSSGGAIYCNSSSKIVNSTFNSNQAKYGGAIASNSNLNIFESDFKNNYANTYVYSSGGAIYNSSDLTIVNTMFNGNRSSGSGGAIVLTSDADFAKITSSIFDNNTSTDGNGGAIYYYNRNLDKSFTLSLYNSNFIYNEADEGIAIHVSSNSEIYNCAFVYNDDGNEVIYTNNLILSNSLIYKNIATYAIKIKNGTLNNSTIADNMGDGIYLEGSSDVRNCNIFNNERYNVINYSDESINATNNFWGTNDIASIYMTIYDKYDDPQKGEVDFGHSSGLFLENQNFNAPLLPPLIEFSSTKFLLTSPINNSITSTFIIRNLGGNVLNISKIDFNDLIDKPFYIISDDCSNNSLNKDENCSLLISFQPKSYSTFTSNIVVNSDALNCKQKEVILNGETTICDFEGDDNELEWNIDENYQWIVQDKDKHTGNYSLKSPNDLPNNTSSSVYFSKHTYKGIISFYFKVSSEYDGDYLIFKIDDVEKDRWSGKIEWTREDYYIEEGLHKFEWIYSKDYSYAANYDSCWIDNICFPLKQDNNKIFLPTIIYHLNSKDNIDLAYIISLLKILVND
ncbi:conserved hypothetical protein, secreted [Candidatus Magnetomorum sp. HK-1]|nr:conserved hypothetical protein, secreted [Candidatus Magnetomorum sp. HK-1]